MNEEINDAINKIKSDIDSWEIVNITDESFDKKTDIAKNLEFQLSLLKLMIGIDKFNELPYFNRVLKQVSIYLNNLEKKEGGQ